MVAISAFLCFPARPPSFWTFLDAFPSQCPIPSHSGGDPWQTFNAPQQHFQRTSTIMLQLSRQTRWLLCFSSQNSSLLRLQDFVPFKIENYRLFLCSLVLSISFLAGALPEQILPFYPSHFSFLAVWEEGQDTMKITEERILDISVWCTSQPEGLCGCYCSPNHQTPLHDFQPVGRNAHWGRHSSSH